MQVLPLKVKIGLKSGNQHAFPDFNKIEGRFRDNMDWSHYIDKFGGWNYDQTSGHADHSTHSPRDEWLSMFLVPLNFANEAVRLFPSQCSILTETEAEDFYNNFAHVRDPEIHEDVSVLQALAAKKQLGMELDQGDLNALDENYPQPGRRVNKRKTWVGFKQAEGITILERK